MRPATVHPYGRQGASLYDLPTLRSQNTGSAAENTERLTGKPGRLTVFSVRATEITVRATGKIRHFAVKTANDRQEARPTPALHMLPRAEPVSPHPHIHKRLPPHATLPPRLQAPHKSQPSASPKHESSCLNNTKSTGSLFFVLQDSSYHRKNVLLSKTLGL